MNAATDSLAPYAARRQAFAQQMGANAIALIPTAPVQVRNRDSDFPYRHDSYFYYLTGFDEPSAWLVLQTDAAGALRSTLFCQPKDLEREIWDGYRLGPEAAVGTLGVDAAHPIEALEAQVPAMMENTAAVLYPFATHPGLAARVEGWLEQVRARVRYGVVFPSTLRDACAVLDEMRLIKDAHEIALIRRACAISAQAHVRAMQTTARMLRAGQDVREYHIEAELLHAFRSQGAQGPAYGNIVAAGGNACVLHYQAGNAPIRDGEMVLIDAGCELDGYASDITRSYPANGRFTPAQRAVYDLVLAAEEAAIAHTQPGVRHNDIHDVTVRVISQGLLDLGLLDKNKYGSVDEVIANRAYFRFYMHRAGHWMGMDVHDCGSYVEPGEIGHSSTRQDALTGETIINRPSRILRPGMIFTIEPGIYIRPADDVPEAFWNIGIRIEDDVLVTDSGCELLTRDAPVAADAIEALMRA
ncbi:MAG: aminopeptidase P N-terminal domain-containing protein [Brachymonas sp.]|nr:aminopeptidase P N-terminal domain-containing protein [Brachymonas sp.]